jgi:large subunit ribosomal protein L33
MAKGKNQIILMVPEGERKSYKYSFTVIKSTAMHRSGKKLRMHKYDPSKRKHVWFEERKVPSHN